MTAAKRFVELFGLRFEIADYDTLMAETNGTGKHLVACLRVSDEIRPPLWNRDLIARRMRLRCIRCREVIWFDPKSSPYLPGAVRICLQCCNELGDEGRKALLH